MGWSFGFKLHLICNEKGELLNFMITPGDIATVNHWNIKPLLISSTANLLETRGI